MNRFKLIVLSSALSLITVGVFAGRAKFVTAQLYASTSSTSPNMGNSAQLTGTADLIGFNTSGSTQSTVNGSGTTRYLYAYDGASFSKLYSTGW